MSRFLFTCLICVSVLWAFPAAAEPSTIIVLRHAEKINDDDVHLSPKGQRRAQALADYFSQKEFSAHYGEIAALYAVHADDGQSERSIETLEPTAKALGLTVDDSYGKGEEHPLMRDILDDSSYDGRAVIISWSHGSIPKLFKKFRDELDIPHKWPKGAYDRFWVLTKGANGEWSFADLPEHLLPGDSAR